MDYYKVTLNKGIGAQFRLWELTWSPVVPTEMHKLVDRDSYIQAISQPTTYTYLIYLYNPFF
jgi:hypothetical protein